MSLAGDALLAQDVGVSMPRTRHQFPAAYKQAMVDAAARGAQRGELGALLRREGLYASHLAVWRAASARGEFADAPVRRGPKPAESQALTPRVPELERQVQRQTARAERVELIVEVKKSRAAAGPRAAAAEQAVVMQTEAMQRECFVEPFFQTAGRGLIHDRQCPDKFL